MLTRSLKPKGRFPLPWTRPGLPYRRCMAHVSNVSDIPSEDTKPFNVPIPEDSFETYNLDPPPYSVETTKGQLKQLYHDMSLIRRMELAADKLYKEQKVRGFCHLSTGQEAVAVGIEHGISRDDKVITAYRAHGFTLMRGGSVKSILGELLGRRDGICHGKGGSVHMYTKNFFGGNGIVGANVPLGTGIAFAQQYDDTRRVTVNVYGDGAANQGQVHEAYNMAKLWELPVIFACENNKYGMGTSVERASAMTEYYKRGNYIPGLRINGMDVLAVISAIKYGKEYALAGNGPLLYEFQTYRYAGHSVSDPGTSYRTKDEVQAERAHDPITNYRERLIDWGVLTKEEAKGMDKEIRSKVDREAQEAEKMPAPPVNLDVLFEDTYVRGSEPQQRRGRTVDETYYRG
ncbi:pyruvate dehydrogenase E1 component subunit alpha [Aspergillus sclerotioniger CBS 115572]|uniref:Pyruvate dehydrogenase E1 component subunit alpha n=1 Tax=Aspergillus sclerotioniger CBS 115572 TaxID=1450535 RepID=A0A317V434_9EURO|nr:pyruvate dehydrogenase E1 component subunit alpha [Aspergillus sclerotioniger CBS 115572]PWY68101.1 pyruvate dehydrogenase E1 component subunit alpha [Aspergillus sclerotioniger CBS 115572]